MTARLSLARDLLQAGPYLRDPFPVWERLRNDAPIWYDPVADRWVVTRYHDVLEVLRDGASYGVERPYRRFSDQIGPSLVNHDGTAHAVRRALVAPELVGRRLEARLPGIAARIERELERWPATGRVDALATAVARVPLLVIAELLGLSGTHEDFLASCSADILHGLGGDREAALRGRAAHRALAASFDPIIRARRASPAGDLISGIIGAHGSGERMPDSEIHSFISLLLVAGGETAGLAIANLWSDLIARPDALALMRDEPGLIDGAFSESLRLDGPVIAEDRTVNVPVEWYGVPIPAGATMRAYIGSANNDESVFRQPRLFDPQRPDLHQGKESRHGGRDPDGRSGQLTFGAGDHFCLGYQLARVEAVTATRRLIERYGSISFVPGREPSFAVALALMRRVDRLELLVG